MPDELGEHTETEYGVLESRVSECALRRDHRPELVLRLLEAGLELGLLLAQARRGLLLELPRVLRDLLLELVARCAQEAPPNLRVDAVRSGNRSKACVQIMASKAISI